MCVWYGHGFLLIWIIHLWILGILFCYRNHYIISFAGVPTCLRQIDFIIQQSRTLHYLFCLIFLQFLNVLSNFHAFDPAQFYLHVIYECICYISSLLYSSTLKIETIYSSSLALSQLHGFTTQKTALSIVTSVKILVPSRNKSVVHFTV
jgi:hypothetical protein